MSRTNLRKVGGYSALAQAKLESSGIDEEQAVQLGFYETHDASTVAQSFDPGPGLILPYFDFDGKPLKAHPTWPEFFRLRYLAADTPKGFEDVTGAKKQRYTQPPGTGVCAYFPRCYDWHGAAANVSETLMITEGELKAGKATLEGFPTIGLGGVYSFRASNRGVFWLPELERILWARRKVIITYDSDYVDKPNICRAINLLAEELQERGALVELATLPDVYDDGRKTGLDDFLVEQGDDALLKVLKAAEPIAMSTRLWAMNEEVVYAREPGLIVDQRTNYKLTPSAFTGHSDWSTDSVPERTVSKDGSISYEKVSAAQTWIKWPLRKSVAKVTYAPGKSRLVKVGKQECWNQWEGWGCEPKKGDVAPWLKLCAFIFEGADKEFVEWFYDWCAYPIQHPGTKLFSAVVVHGVATGTGKTLIGYTLGKIYGKNFTKIENKHLSRDFNSWAENRQFVLGDEISGSDKRSEADAMKTVITQEEISINIKMLPEYVVPDCINYYFTSNHSDAFFIEDADRRYAVHEVMQSKPMADEFYKEYNEWKDGDGPAHLMHWLLQRKLTKFNPKAAAFKTAARARMAMHGKSDLAVWCTELREHPEDKLRFGKQQYIRDMFTSAELLRMYQQDNEGGMKVTGNGMARALAAAGFHHAFKGMPVMVNGKQGRYFIIRNPDTWRSATLKDIAKHISANQGVGHVKT